MIILIKGAIGQSAIMFTTFGGYESRYVIPRSLHIHMCRLFMFVSC